MNLAFDDRAADSAAAVFFRRHGLRLDEISAKMPDMPEDSIVLLTGSVAEGLANDLSDVDLYVITPETFRPEVPMLIVNNEYDEFVFRLAGGFEVNVIVWNAGFLRDCGAKARRLREAINDPSKISKIEAFSYWEEQFLHNLRVGVPLTASERAVQLKADMASDVLPHVQTLAKLTDHFSLREDVIGNVRHGEIGSAAWIYPQVMDTLAAACICSTGCSNTKFKWRYKCLDVCRDGLGEPLTTSLQAYLRQGPDAFSLDTFRAAMDFADEAIRGCIGRAPQIAAAASLLATHITYELDAQNADSGLARPGSAAVA